jgi:hypothetical protein
MTAIAGLVARGLDREHEVARGSEALADRGVALPHLDGPRPNGGRRLHVVERVLRVRRERQRHLEDEGVVPLAVVRAAAPYLLEAKRGVCGPRGCVLLVHLERCRGGVQHVRVVADARHEPGRDAPATPVARDDDVSHLEVVARELAAREADDGAEVVRDPPAAAGLRELVVEHALAPRRVGSARVGIALERRDGRQVVHGHGT